MTATVIGFLKIYPVILIEHLTRDGGGGMGDEVRDEGWRRFFKLFLLS